MKSRVFALVVLLLAAADAHAALKWEATRISQVADPLSGEAVAIYKFSNVGDNPVAVRIVKTSCGCTTAELPKQLYKSGESGEIVAKLKLDGRQGLQVKTITVGTDDGEPRQMLTMETFIPTVLKFHPAFVFWRRGEEPEAKTIEIQVGTEQAVHIIKAASDNSDISFQLETVEAGKHYRLTLFPATTAQVLKARISLLTDYPTEKPKIYYAYAHVKESGVEKINP